MTDQKSNLDENGKPIPAKIEGESTPPKVDAKKEEFQEDIDDPVVPVRDSSSHIIARQKRTIEKLRSKNDEEADEGDEDDYSDVLSPHVKKALEEGIERQIKPVIGALAGQADRGEFEGLIQREPEAKKYEKRIKAYMKHEAWAQVPVEAIYHHLAFNAAAAAGAKGKNIADKEAAHVRGAGTSHRPVDVNDSGIPSAEDIDNMSDEEFDALQRKVATGAFVKK
ncbi:hypothetical protein HY469_02225 [Candidatus Roizmanbacteria bacterium]|nr:hypothetical protein [Candidatus Roizmanbacteria bacterium]